MGTGTVVRRVGASIVAGMLASIALPAAVGATDIPLKGNRMHLVDSSQPAGRRNAMGFLDHAVTLVDVDPTVTGATVYIGRVGVGAVTTIDLPASGWSQTGTAPRIQYKFKSLSGPVTSARIRDGLSLRISSHGDGIYALDSITQDAVGVIVQFGQVRFCGLFGGTIRRDDGKMFQARKAPAPQDCPDLGSTTTTTTSTTETTTTETTTTESTTTTTIPCIATSNETVGMSTAAEPADQACVNAASNCCSLSAFQLQDSVDMDGNHTCTGVCGEIIG